MMKLEEIMQRFLVRRGSSEPATQPLEASTHPPRIINGMAELLRHLGEQQRRIDNLEKQVAEIRGFLNL